MARIEAGLLLLDVDFSSSRFAWTDADRATPQELGLGWMLRGVDADDRALHRPRRDPPRAAPTRRRAARRPGSSSTGATGTGSTTRPGLIPPKDHTPVQEEYYLYDDDGATSSATRRA